MGKSTHLFGLSVLIQVCALLMAWKEITMEDMANELGGDAPTAKFVGNPFGLHTEARKRSNFAVRCQMQVILLETDLEGQDRYCSVPCLETGLDC